MQKFVAKKSKQEKSASIAEQHLNINTIEK